MNEIQQLRKELTNLIANKIKPMRQRLDELLNSEAEKLCPFKIGDIITLDNGKKGQIMEIKYYSIDYEFYKDESNDFFNNYIETVDDIHYTYSYSIDNKSFSITWEISGLRLIKNDTEVGKIRFIGINPAYYIIDKEEKKVTRKNLNHFISDGSDIFSFDKFDK